MAEDLTFIFVSMGFIIGAMLSAMVWLLWKFMLPMMWPISAPVMRQRGNGFVWDLGERAKKVKHKDGFEALKLMKGHNEIREPEYEFLMLNDKGKPVYPLFSPITGQFSRLKFHNSPPNISFVEDKASKNWGIMELRRAEEKYQEKGSFFDKYGTFIMSMTMAVVIIFLVIFSWGKFEIVASSLEGAANNLALAMAKLPASNPNIPVLVTNST